MSARPTTEYDENDSDNEEPPAQRRRTTKKKREPPGKMYMWTMHNWTEEICAKLADPAFVGPDGLFKYICYGKEICPTTGTPHLQCMGSLHIQERSSTLIPKFNQHGLHRKYADLDKAKATFHILGRKTPPAPGMYAKAELRFKTLKRPNGQPPPGKCDCCICYCMKDGNKPNGGVTELGEWPYAGRRTDCEYAVESLKAGQSIGDIVSERPNLSRMINQLEKVREIFSSRRNWVTRVTVIVGPSGAHKTDNALQILRHKTQKEAFIKTPGSKEWFNGYEGQEGAVIDEVHGGSSGITFDFMLTLMNAEPTLVPYKGGFINWAPKWLFLTSTTPLKDWYKPPVKDLAPAFAPQHPRIAELTRRVDHVIDDWQNEEELMDKLVDVYPEITAEPRQLNTRMIDRLKAAGH